MTEVVIKKGTYGSKTIEHQKFNMHLTPRKGKKGLYVTVDGGPLGQKRNIRVLIENENHVVPTDNLQEPQEPMVADEVVETDKEIMQRLRQKFQVLDAMTLAAIEGNVNAIIVTGPPGVGKSFGVETIIESMDVMAKMELHEGVTNIDAKLGIEKVSSASPLGLYQLLWEYRNPGSVLVLDDSDSILYDEAALNMLKAATDSGKHRRLTWRTESKILEERGIPDMFEFEGAIMFITNLDFEKARGRIGLHLQAIVSRCHYLDMGIHSTHEKFLRCKQIIRDGMLSDYNFTSYDEAMIIDYIDEHKHELRELSLRCVKKIADLAKMAPHNWQMYAAATCMKGK